MRMTPQQEAEELDEATRYMASARSLLEAAIKAVDNNKQSWKRMEYRNRQFGITKSRDTFTLLSLTRGHYHQIGNTHDGMKAIVVYQEEKQTGYGLFDDDQVTCLRLDLDELILEIMAIDDNPVVQRQYLEGLLFCMDHLSRP